MDGHTMTRLYRDYIEQVHDAFGLWATWELPLRVDVGDVGPSATRHHNRRELRA